MPPSFVFGDQQLEVARSLHSQGLISTQVLLEQLGLKEEDFMDARDRDLKMKDELIETLKENNAKLEALIEDLKKEKSALENSADGMDLKRMILHNALQRTSESFYASLNLLLDYTIDQAQKGDIMAVSVLLNTAGMFSKSLIPLPTPLHHVLKKSDIFPPHKYEEIQEILNADDRWKAKRGNEG